MFPISKRELVFEGFPGIARLSCQEQRVNEVVYGALVERGLT